jgi:MerR family transcriptional regulator/heat shock protein HspR
MVGLQPTRVRRYVKRGLVTAEVDDRGAPVLGAAELARLRRIRRLTTDLGLNMVGVEVVLRLLDQIDALQANTRLPAVPEDVQIRGLLGTGDQTRRRQQ